jgi:hypothetical protein
VAGPVDGGRAAPGGGVVLCPRMLQAAMVYLNTLMLQDVLADPEWEDELAPTGDRRGLTPLFWAHV